MSKFDRVLWFHNGKVAINGRYHRDTTHASALRLLHLLGRISYYSTLTGMCTIYQVNRG